MRTVLILSVLALAGPGMAWAEDPPAPDIDKVVADIAAVGPEALLAHVKGLKTQEQALKAQAEDLRKQAGKKDAEAQRMRKRIDAVDKFTTELVAVLNPPPPVETPAAPPPAAPEPTPAVPAAAPDAPASPDGMMNAAPETGDGAS